MAGVLLSSPPQASRHVVRRLLSIAWQYRARCAAVLGAQVCLLLLTMASMGLSGAAMDVLHATLVAAPKDAPAPRFPFGLSPPAQLSGFDLVLAIAGLIAVMGVLRALLSYTYQVAVADLVQGRIVPKLRAQVYDKLHQLSFCFFDRHDSGTLLNRLTEDVQSLRAFIDAVLIQGLVVVLALSTYGGYMLHTHVGLALACLGTTPILWLVTARFSQRIIPAYAKSRERLDSLVSRVTETVHGIQVILGFAATRKVLDELAHDNAQLLDSQQAIFHRVSRYTPTVDALTHINTLALLSYGGALVVQGQLTFGDLVVFAGLLQQFATQVTTLATIIDTLQQSLIGARRVFEVLDEPLDIVSPPEPRPLPRVRGQLRFERVSFGYTTDKHVLNDIHIDVRPGECIAIYGAAGAGKTSLLSLVPRFYDVTQGSIRVDGIDVRELSLHELRQQVAMVFQESFLFSHTIAENIAFGRPGADHISIEHAARLACADEFIEGLPKGYQTPLGELASNLSGGQRQRLAVARSLLTDPQVLLLDDVTAALDAETTRAISASLRGAAQGRTTLMVTHRLELLQQADRILVLERGRIVQQGTHLQLATQTGLYSELLELHAERKPASRTSPRQELTD